MRVLLACLALSSLVVSNLQVRSQTGGETAKRCDGTIQVSNLAPPRREGAALYRLYVRGVGANARYYSFGVLPGDAHSAQSEQLLLKNLGIDPASRIGDSYASIEEAEKGAIEHCRACASDQMSPACKVPSR